MARNPEAYAGGVSPRGGGPFRVGADWWPSNPRHTVPRAYHHVVRMWSRCRAGMGGLAQLPEPGGLNQQPAWLIAAFGVLDAAEAQLEDIDKPEGGA